MARLSKNQYSKPLNNYELKRHVIRFSHDFFPEVVEKKTITVDISGVLKKLHIDKYGRGYLSEELFSQINTNQQTTLIITRIDSVYKLELKN